jgi:hypothetical protein
MLLPESAEARIAESPSLNNEAPVSLYLPPDFTLRTTFTITSSKRLLPYAKEVSVDQLQLRDVMIGQGNAAAPMDASYEPD